jgi:hypothetical protein
MKGIVITEAMQDTTTVATDILAMFLKALKLKSWIVMSAALVLKPQAKFHNPRIR